MCFTLSTVAGSSRRPKSTTSSGDSTISSIDSRPHPVLGPPSAEWFTRDKPAKSHRHHGAPRQEEDQQALSGTFGELVARNGQAAVDQRRPRNRLSRQHKRQVDTAERSSPLRQVQSPTDSEMDRQWHEQHTNSRPRGCIGPSMAPSAPPSSLISIAASTTQPEPAKESFLTPSPRPQQIPWTASEIQESKEPRINLYTDEKYPALRKRTDSLRQRAPASLSQSSSSSSSSSSTTTPSTPSTEATDSPSAPPCPTFATTFNSMVIHHLRTNWPTPTAKIDILTREEVLSLIYARLKRTPTGVGRERWSVHDSEEDFIERRALVVAQGVRRDLKLEMREKERRGERLLREAVEEREFREVAVAALRYK